MAIQWTEDIAVGVVKIDNQHKELFARINALFEACNQGKGTTEIGRTVAFLEEYTETHFNTEEQYMVKTKYPDYELHKEQHDIFRKNLSDIKRRLDKEGPGIHIVIMINNLVIDWLRNHIRTFDKKFGTYVPDRI